MTTSDFIVMGKISSVYGVKGWLKIISYTEVIADILNYDPWYIEEKNGWQALDIEEGKPYGKGIIAKIKGIDSPEEGRQLAGKLISVQRSQLPKLSNNEFYWSDLEGLTVLTQNGNNLGQVAYLIATGANDVLVVKGEKEHAIPYLNEVIVNIDLTKKVITVNWEE